MIDNPNRIEFTMEMKKDYTILIPNMLNIHFTMLARILQDDGYKVELLKTEGPTVVREGVQNVHNDTCYPALLVIGQMIDSLKSGQYDLNKTALIITQTGGGCRASNYINLLRKALKKNNMEQIPVISLNFLGMEHNSGFPIGFKFLTKAIYAVIYGDMLMWISNQCKPYEINQGDSQKVIDKWCNEICNQLHSPKQFLRLKENFNAMLDDFSAIPRRKEQKVKVGVVGEIYMKYSPLGNNHLEEIILREGAEPVLSGLLDFILYCVENMIMDYKLYGVRKQTMVIGKFARWYLIHPQKVMIKCIAEHGEFRNMSNFNEMKHMADGYIHKGVKMGEGWLLTNEMLELINSGVNNIVCCQPFGCLPNHIVAKGMMRKIKDHYPMSNIVPIDYDPGASHINQENRIKLMLANAKENEKILAEGKAA